MTFEQPSRVVLGVFIAIAALAIIGVFLLTTAGYTWADVSVGKAEQYHLRVADTPMERARGLSGVSLAEMGADGMLFLFPDEAVRNFTMKGMSYNLDFLWIRDGKILRIDRNVPATIPGAQPIELTSDPLLVDMVVELPAGKAQEMNFQVGHQLTIVLDGKE